MIFYIDYMVDKKTEARELVETVYANCKAIKETLNDLKKNYNDAKSNGIWKDLFLNKATLDRAAEYVGDDEIYKETLESLKECENKYLEIKRNNNKI